MEVVIGDLTWVMLGWSATEVNPIVIDTFNRHHLYSFNRSTEFITRRDFRSKEEVMRCSAIPLFRPTLVLPRTRIIARSYISTSVRSNIDYIPQRLRTNTGLRSNTPHHRIRSTPLRIYSRYSTTTSVTKNDDDHSALNPLPLPHGINPSKGLFLIHLQIPPKHWPSHLDLYFPLLRRTTKWMKEKGVVVNCIYDGIGTETEFKEGGYVARLYTRHGSMEWNGFDEELLGSEGFKGEIDQLLANPPLGLGDDSEMEIKEILVCTHGSRDCRCSDLGGQLVESLRTEIKSRNLGLVVREIAHVGGHK